MHRFSKSSVILTIGTLVTGLALVPRGASAQTIPSSFRFVEEGREAGIYAGVVSTNPGTLELAPNKATVIGARLGANLGSALAFELDGYLFNGERDVRDPRRAEDLQVVGTSDMKIAGVDARFRLNLTGQRSWKRLQPFVMLGAGLAWTINNDRTAETEADVPMENWFQFGTKFAPVAGGGVTLHASERWILRLDGVFRLWKVDTPDGFDTAEGIGGSEWVGNSLLTLGIGFRF